MRPGTILRGYNYNEDSKEIVKSTSLEEIEKISQEARETLDKKLEEYQNTLNTKIDDINKYKLEIEEEYKTHLNSQNEEFKALFDTINIDYSNLVQKLENNINDYISNLHQEVKDITLTLFEKFFFTQYKDMDNLDSLIQNSLRQLEDSSKIQISMADEYYKAYEEEKKEQVDKYKERNILFTSHNSDSLICEIKSEEGNIEIDFNNQIEKIKNLLK